MLRIMLCHLSLPLPPSRPPLPLSRTFFLLIPSIRTGTLVFERVNTNRTSMPANGYRSLALNPTRPTSEGWREGEREKNFRTTKVCINYVVLKETRYTGRTTKRRRDLIFSTHEIQISTHVLRAFGHKVKEIIYIIKEIPCALGSSRYNGTTTI